MGVIFVYSYMEYIDNSHKIRIEWTILRGTSKVREDFSRAKLALILLGPDWRYQLSPDIVDVEKGVIKTEIPAGLPEGVYGIKAIWIKDDHHPCEGRHFIHPKHPPVPPAHHPVPVGPHFYPYAGMWHKGYIPAPLDIRINSGKLAQARKDDLFGVTELVPECEHPGNTIVIKISSSVATYGYDGLDAYELAVLHGETMTEEEWLAGQSGGAGFRVIDSVDDAYIDDSTDALSVRQGVLLRQEIDRIWAKIEECCGKMAKITLTPNTLRTINANGNVGDPFEYTYEAEGAVGKIEVVAEGKNAENEGMSINLVEDPNPPQGTKRGRIYVTIPSTQTLRDNTFTLVVRGVVDGHETARAEANILQLAYSRNVVSRTVTSATLQYDMISGEGGYRMPTFAGLMTVTYDAGEPDVNVPFKLTDSFVVHPGFAFTENSTDGVDDSHNIEFDTTSGRIDRGVSSWEQNHLLGTVTLSFSIDGVEKTVTAEVWQGGASERIISRGRMYVESFAYPTPISNTSPFTATPSINVQQEVYYNTGRPGTQPVDYRTLNPQFSIAPSSGVTVDETGKVTRTSANTGTETLTYIVTMTLAGIDADSTASVSQPVNGIKEYGTVNITWKYPLLPQTSHQIGYDGGSSTPLITKITQKVVYSNDVSETVTVLNAPNGVSVSEAISRAELTNPNFSFSGSHIGVSIVGDTGVVSADPNTESSSDYKSVTINFTGSRNGKTFSSSTTLKQDTVNRYIWCGYSETTPAEFGNWKHSDQYVAEANKQYVVTTTLAERAKCHWILIPENSTYQLSKVLNVLGMNVINSQEYDPISDKGRNYILCHWTYDAFIEASTTYILD